jgi:hypothetical protein
MPDKPQSEHGHARHGRLHDAALVVAKAAVSAIPGVGGPLASLMEFIPTATQQNEEKAIGFFRDKIGYLETRLDIDAVNKDDFAELFKSCSLVIARTHREEKLHAAANILATLLLRAGDQAKVSYGELDHLIRCVDALSIGAISVLGAIREVSATHLLGSQQEAVQFGELRRKLQMDGHFLRSLVSELDGFHLVRVQEAPLRGYAEAEYDGDQLTLSRIGKRLIEQFIEGKM